MVNNPRTVYNNKLKKMVSKALVNTSIQPFKENPSQNHFPMDKDKHMNAHELFSLYTANIIREEIVYAR